jgi:hypothetical protein
MLSLWFLLEVLIQEALVLYPGKKRKRKMKRQSLRGLKSVSFAWSRSMGKL